LRRRYWAISGGIENVGFDLASVSLSWDFFAVQQEAEAGGVSRFYDDLVAGSDGGMRGRDEGFTGDGFAVRHERDPGVLLGTDLYGEGRGRLRGSHVRSGPGRLSAWLRRLGGRLARGTGAGCRRGWRVGGRTGCGRGRPGWRRGVWARGCRDGVCCLSSYGRHRSSP